MAASPWPMWCARTTTSPIAAFVDRVFPILGETFGDIRPAATMIVCGLNKPEMKIEIEVTALRRL